MKTNGTPVRRSLLARYALAGAAAVFAATWLAPRPPARAAATDTAAKPADAAKQAAEVQKLLTQYRKPGLPAEQKGQIVDQLLELNSGPQQLAAQLARDFSAKGPAYLAKFERAASDAVRAKWKGKGNVEQEVEGLRKAVLAVSRSADLSKESIHDKADPAMEKLDALMSVTREEVLASQSDLKAQREELIALPATWRRAADKTPDDARKKAPALPDPAAFETELTNNETLAAYMGTPMAPADRAVLVANLPLARNVDAEEARGILVLNLMRIRLGIGALAIDPKLVEAARGHCKDMKEKSFFAHESPVPGKETPWKRAEKAGTSANAENIFMGSPSGEAAIKAWWYSPGHHKNMMGGGRRVGLGRYESHWTQMFGN